MIRGWLAFLVLSAALLVAQSNHLPPGNDKPADQQPPRSDDAPDTGASSSRDTKGDITPPKDDTKKHPNSGISDADDSSDVQEMHPWDPHKALKDIEVGDYYFKRKNFRAALDRYQEALVYKADDAIANLRMAECFEKLEKPEEAVTHYQEYLRILPHGPLAPEAQKALERLKSKNQAAATSGQRSQ